MSVPARLPPKSPKGPIARYALGTALGVAAALLQWAIHPWVGSHVPFLFFLPALLLSAASLGRGPAILVLVLGAVNAALLSPPVGSFSVTHPHDLAALWAYAAVGTLLVLYGGHLRITTTRAALAEKRLSLAQEDTGMGVFELDFVAGTAYVSPSLSQILGQPLQQSSLRLDDWLGRLNKGHVAESRRAMQERIAKGELAYEREQRVELPNGDLRWLLHRVRLDANADGVLTQARGATVDITARKHVDALLQTAQAKLQQQLQDLERLHGFSQKLVSAGGDFKAALQGLLDLLVNLYGTRHGVVSLCDPGDKTLELVAQCGFGADTVENLPSALGLTRRRVGRISEAHQPVDDADYEALIILHRALTVQEGLYGMHSMPLVSGSGEVMGVISVMFDEPREVSEREVRLGEVGAATAAAVVERERARLSAAKNEQRFSVALESSIVPFSILKPVRNDAGTIVDFEWTYLNPAAARALGREIKDLTGSPIGELLPKAWDAPGLFERYVGVVERGEQCEFEVLTNVTGHGGWYNVIASPLQGSAAVWFANINERKLHEQNLHDADRRKDEFLAMLAHELRNPLAPIRQAVRIARSGASSEAQRRWSHGIIERQVQNMSLLLDDMLDVSRIGRGTLLLRKSREFLATVVAAAIETTRPHIEAKRHRLEVALPEEPVALDIDPLRIAQVLGNLLTNSAKYTEPGGLIRLTAAVEADQVVIRIADNGIGLTREQASQVFELFSQMPAAMEKSEGGLGIGLALSRGLIELHGGRIEASSAGAGHGTEVTVRLPYHGASSQVIERDPTPATPVLARSGQPAARRILIADDNADAADSLAELLRLEGHEVQVAYDGEQALSIFFTIDPDAALLDVGMPRLSGLEVALAIRERASGQRATLIAVTGWGQERDRRTALESGFDYHLTKPIQPEDIQALIDVGRSRALSQSN
jgi:signal transduction histidine kinase/ActR/RegA family two-component response regulator